MYRMIKNIKWLLEKQAEIGCVQNVQNDKEYQVDIRKASRNKACVQNVQNDKEYQVVIRKASRNKVCVQNVQNDKEYQVDIRSKQK